ncbi:MAG: zinc ribbon domain-containing protein [Candidatus Thermoplasmatota archaeon]
MPLSEIQIVLIVIMVLVILAELWVIRRRRKQRQITRYEASASDRAFNTILATEKIYEMMLSQGIASEEGRALLRDARRCQASGRFTEAVERAEAAREKLAEAKMGVETQEIITASASRSEPLTPAPHQEEGGKEELPENYMQSKFMISTVEEGLRKAGQKGVATTSSRQALEEARKAFEAGDYTSALSKALRARKILQGMPPAPLGGPEETAVTDISAPIPAAQVESVEVLRCQQCSEKVSHDDVFCRRCGVKLEFVLICPGCSAEVGGEDRFCRKCGTKLG